MTNRLFREAIAFIYNHIDDPFTIDDLASALQVSRDTLEREFHRAAETSPAKLARRLRGELAFRTLQDRNQSVIQVALAAGYSDHSAFSRSFRSMFGFSPSAARTRTVIQRDLDHIELSEPDIIELRAMELQCVTESGSYFEGPARAWERLEQKIRAANMEPLAVPLWVGQALDDPHHEDVPPDLVRFQAGVDSGSVQLGLPTVLIPEARYLRFAFTGKPDNLGLAFHYIYGLWRERTDMTIAGRPALILFTEPPASTAVEEVSICVPLADALS